MGDGEWYMCVPNQRQENRRFRSCSVLFFFSSMRSSFIVWCISCQPLSIMKAYSLVWGIRGVFLFSLITHTYNIGKILTMYALSPSLHYYNFPRLFLLSRTQFSTIFCVHLSSRRDRGCVPIQKPRIFFFPPFSQSLSLARALTFSLSFSSYSCTLAFSRSENVCIIKCPTDQLQ